MGVSVESNLGLLDLSLPGPCADGLRKGNALLSKEFKDALFDMVKDDSYRITVEKYNSLMYRPVNDEVTLSQLTTYEEHEGLRLIDQKVVEADTILRAYECFDDNGLVKEDAEIPDELKPIDPEWITVNAIEVINDLDTEVLDKLSTMTVNETLEMDTDELMVLMGGPSEPSTSKLRHPVKRRDSRVETDSEAKEEKLQKYAVWLNNNEDVDWKKKLLCQWNVEKDSSQTARISIDAVLVEEQDKNHIPGGKPEMKQEKSYIKHWDIRVDADNKSYFITGLDEKSVYKQLIAVLIKNKLINRFLVFFIDGETKINEHIQAYFKPWPHAVYLDFHHLQEKIEQIFSSAIITRKVDDPTAEPEYYQRGEKAGQLKNPDKISLSRLYAKEAISMAWSGNLVPLVAYIRLIPDEFIKNQAARQKLLTYIRNKQEWITCYRLRKLVGLPNSSNAVEQENQLVVSQRQKDELMAWRENGSTSLAAITAMYLNREQDMWYDHHRIPFELWTNQKSAA